MRLPRTWLTALLVGTLGAVGATAPAAAAGPDRLPITLTNDSGRDEQVVVHVLGTDLSSGRLGWVDAQGTFHPWPAGSNPPSPAPDSALTGPADGEEVTVQVPRGFSGRVYFSFGESLPFSLTPDGLVQPAPWAADDPTRDILFDWSELTYNDAGLWLNSSQVDMFGVPHSVSVTGALGATRTTGEVVPGGRQQVIDAVAADPEWADSVITRDDGTVLRVLAPGKAASAGLMSRTFLDQYIASAWDAYRDRDLTVQPFGDRPEIRYTGRTSGTTLRLTDASGREVASFERPSSADVWGCDGALHAPNDQAVGPIARTLCAALFRGTLGTSTTEPVLDARQFYRGTPPNVYGRAVHEAMVDGRAYAFAFDDVGAFESLVHDGNPRSARIHLTPFGSEQGTGGGTGAGDGAVGDGAAGDRPTAGPVRSAAAGKCLDVRGGDDASGTPVQLYDCNGTAAQHWTFGTDGTLSALGKCLDVTERRTANGSNVQIWDCNPGQPNQTWVRSGDSYLNPASGRCLDNPDGRATNRQHLQIWDCLDNDAQRWTAPGA
ncbi:beta-1,3-glucanase family protein [Cellulomonas bogoriensis]|uniref:Glucan endo-1,3-beta-D-glucosidase n=1 Tax=Cellulomonas bogoriensis 69B4 = DSM 16987 TaxID=1386082 RepID=A0A0A0C094_9CELL|nr:beta-1,3-glucanase family protein [Cellulomonas bogoriensis]KGM14083.1 glucan endo-1,3-beta-D-glucosidase [Cellulomonas bogoriensis 69B4 = DSM 16987]